MNPSKAVGFQFQVIWFDSDSIELCISAWNGAFGGTAYIYDALSDLEGAAARLHTRTLRQA